MKGAIQMLQNELEYNVLINTELLTETVVIFPCVQAHIVFKLLVHLVL